MLTSYRHNKEGIFSLINAHLQKLDNRITPRSPVVCACIVVLSNPVTAVTFPKTYTVTLAF